MPGINKYCIGMLFWILLNLVGIVAFAVLGSRDILPDPVCFGAMMGLGITSASASVLALWTVAGWGW